MNFNTFRIYINYISIWPAAGFGVVVAEAVVQPACFAFGVFGGEAVGELDGEGAGGFQGAAEGVVFENDGARFVSFGVSHDVTVAVVYTDREKAPYPARALQGAVEVQTPNVAAQGGLIVGINFGGQAPSVPEVEQGFFGIKQLDDLTPAGNHPHHPAALTDGGG